MLSRKLVRIAPHMACRSDKTHLHQEHLPALRQLVEFRPSQKGADRRDAGIFKHRRRGHRVEIKDTEKSSLPSKTLLAENSRTPIGHVNPHNHHQYHRPEDEKPPRRKQDIEASFDRLLTEGHRPIYPTIPSSTGFRLPVRRNFDR